MIILKRLMNVVFLILIVTVFVMTSLVSASAYSKKAKCDADEARSVMYADPKVLAAAYQIIFPSILRGASGGVSHLAETRYTWIGVGVMAGGYPFLLAIPAASLTGASKIVIERFVGNLKHRERWIYGVAVPVSTVAWFYYLMVFPGDFSITGSVWGKPAYSWMTAFIAWVSFALG